MIETDVATFTRILDSHGVANSEMIAREINAALMTKLKEAICRAMQRE